jgi:hypothetical protein
MPLFDEQVGGDQGVQALTLGQHGTVVPNAERPGTISLIVTELRTYALNEIEFSYI